MAKKARNSLVMGVAVNDAPYQVEIKECIVLPDGKKKWKTAWKCPYYVKWLSMLARCYSITFHKIQPTYKDCSVCEEWLTFSNFKSWMETQDWEGKELDKDLLMEGNKVYSPDTCCFVSVKVNSFLNKKFASRGQLPLGVSKVRKNKYAAQCSNPFKTNSSQYLGYYDSAEEAHLVWKRKKHEYACILAELEKDERVKAALLTRYL